MNEVIPVLIVLGLGIAAFSWIAGLIMGGSGEKQRLENEAVAKGYAEFWIDENNNRQWRWKPAAADR